MLLTHLPGALRSWSKVLLFIAVLRGRVVNLEGCRNTFIRNALNFSLSIIVSERSEFGLIVVMYKEKKYCKTSLL